MLAEERDGVARMKPHEHVWVLGNLVGTQSAERAEPQQHHGAEEAPDVPCAEALDAEEARQDGDGDRNDERVQAGRR